MRWSRATRATSTTQPTRSSHGIGPERDPKRLVTFSDAVIAIAVTLLVLDIRPPEDTRHLLRGLLELWPSYLVYVITFLLIGQMWVNHHVMFDHIRSADRLVILFNTLLLMEIAFLPYASSVLTHAFESGLADLLPLCAQRDIAVMAAGVFQSGLLAEPRTGAAYGYDRVPDALLGRVRALRDLCHRYDVPPLAAAIQFAFGHPSVATVVVGARTPHEMGDNAALLAHPIPPELWQRMKAAGLLPEHAPTPPADA